MEEIQKQKCTIIPLHVLMDMPKEAIFELLEKGKARPAISVEQRFFVVEDTFVEYTNEQGPCGLKNPFGEIKCGTTIFHMKLREMFSWKSETAYQNSEMTLVLRRPQRGKDERKSEQKRRRIPRSNIRRSLGEYTPGGKAERSGTSGSDKQPHSGNETDS